MISSYPTKESGRNEKEKPSARGHERERVRTIEEQGKKSLMMEARRNSGMAHYMTIVHYIDLPSPPRFHFLFIHT